MPKSLNKLMSKDVITVTPQQSLQEAAKLMKEHDIGSIPVSENGHILGMITDRDIALRSTAKGDATSIPVQDCMTTNPIIASSSMGIHEAAKLMSESQIRRLPIVDDGQLVGIVAIGDLATESIYQNEAGEALSSISEPSHPSE